MGVIKKLGEMGIPGFRSGKKLKMAIAIYGYFMMVLFLLTFEPMAMIVVAILMSVIFWYTNFRNIQSNIHIKKIVGFRTGNKYKIAIAIFSYSVLFFFIAGAIILPPIDNKNTTTNNMTPSQIITANTTQSQVTITPLVTQIPISTKKPTVTATTTAIATQIPTPTITPIVTTLTPLEYKGDIRYWIGIEMSQSLDIFGKDMIDYSDGIISLYELNQTIEMEQFMANTILERINSLNVPMGYETTQRRAVVIVETYIDALNNTEKYIATSDNKYLTYYYDDLNKIVRQSEELNKEINDP